MHLCGGGKEHHLNATSVCCEVIIFLVCTTQLPITKAIVFYFSYFPFFFGFFLCHWSHN